MQKDQIISIHSHNHYFQSPKEKKKMEKFKFPYIDERDGKHFLVINERNILDYRPVEQELTSATAMLKKMDEHHVEFRLQWISPWVLQYTHQDLEAQEWFICLHNDDLMNNWVKKYPTRFGGACAIPMNNIEAALKELNRCHAMGYRAVTIGTTVNGIELDDEMFYPIWEEVERLNMLVCVHPNEMPGKDTRWRQWRIGMPGQTALAMDCFTFGGIFEKFEKLKVIFTHGGVGWLSEFGRSLHAYKCRPQKFDTCPDPTSFLRRIKVDTHTSNTKLLKLLVQEFGPSMFLYGDDAPFPLGDYPNGQANYPVVPGRSIRSINFGSNDSRVKTMLFQTNAIKLLRLHM